MDWIADNWPAIVNLIAMVIAFASAVSALTPSKRDDDLVGKLSRLVDFLALNVGHAKPEKNG